MELIRTYSHKTFGDIGEVTLVVPEGAWTLDGKALPEQSVRHLARFALQTLQDSYAGSKTEDEAKGEFAKKLLRLLDGTIGVGGGGDGVSEQVRVERQITREVYKAKLGGKSPEWAKFTGLADDEQNKQLDELFAKNAEALAPAVADKLEELRAARARKAKLTTSFNI